jgi:hypothetical protein
MNLFSREIIWRIMLEKSDIKKAYLWQHRQSMDDRPKIAPSTFYKQL